ncbi:hypothetical protein [Clostridium mediterraneense]|uniref:hypothetical protein n=1 Tax=Clostridium mediterraneense TaxID=1805472 RepID=UPI0008372DBE|nr:hypothetical protein [Clostridium mediterraneense]
MSLDQVKDNTSENQDECIIPTEDGCCNKIDDKQEELIKKFVNDILDQRPEIVENFNKGEISAIEEVTIEVLEKLDFDLKIDILRNIVGEEILIR